MQDDIPMKISELTRIPNYHLNNPELQGYILYELEAILNGFGKCVRDFGLQSPPEHLLKDLKNKLLMEEKNYNRELLMQDAILSVPKLNCEQKKIYDLIMNALTRNEQELLFVYGHGGTGKTFLWKTIISSLRSQGKIVLAVASSGIISLLLSAGHTTHSRFKLPLELTDESLCHVKKNTQLGKLLVETNLIIWDEAPMNDRRCFKTLDRTLRDLMSLLDLIFGGKTVVLGGKPDNEDDQNSCWISIPTEYCVSSNDGGMSELIDFIYNQTTLKTTIAGALHEKAIVCPKNDTADAVNAKIISRIKGQGKTYLSKHKAIPMGKETSETELLYPMEYLNTISFPGFPPHELHFKVGSPIMLLQNVNLSGGLCNGPRMIVTSLMSRLIKAQIITRTRVGDKVTNKKMAENTIGSLKIGQANCVLEARVYSKWVSKNYLGCILSISDITPFRDANKAQGWLRKVDIENLDGNVVEFAMWDDLAKQFNKDEIEKLSRPIIIAVSSCRVSKYREAEYAYTEEYALHVKLQSHLLQKIEAGTIHPVEPLTYRYNFKATVSDGTVVAYFTFFTKAGDKITGSPCSKLVAKYKSMDQRQLPIELVNIIGKTQIFQIYFTLFARQGSGQFTVVDILDIQPALETEQIGITLDVTTTEVTEESTSKGKDKSDA
ncbi:DNA helicase [Tanacetum coccineum]